MYSLDIYLFCHLNQRERLSPIVRILIPPQLLPSRHDLVVAELVLYRWVGCSLYYILYNSNIIHLWILLHYILAHFL